LKALNKDNPRMIAATKNIKNPLKTTKGIKKSSSLNLFAIDKKINTYNTDMTRKNKTILKSPEIRLLFFLFMIIL